MTREQLAQKKGIKTKETTRTAAEALITTKPEIEKEFKPEPETVKKQPSETKKTANGPATKTLTDSKKEVNSLKTGRPKRKPYVKISLNIPEEYLEIVDIAAGIHYKGNKSSYIASLIEKDIKTNGSVYQQIKSIKND